MHYDEQYMLDMLSKAFEGQPAARQSLQNIDSLHAYYDDFSEFMLVQRKRAVQSEEGHWSISPNEMPGDDDPTSRFCVELYTYQKEAASWRVTRMPVPLDYELMQLTYSEDMYWLTDRAGQRAKISYWRLEWMVGDLQWVPLEASEETIREGFAKVMQFVDATGEVIKGSMGANVQRSEKSLSIPDKVKLTYHAEESSYTGDTEWQGNRIHILLHAEDKGEAESMLPAVEQLLDNLNTLDEQARQSLAVELLDIWNKHWLDEYLEEEPYTTAQFASHLKLRELEWKQEQQVCMYYSNAAGLSFSVKYHIEQGFQSHQIG
ncbi:DUF2262 domain-containing protein [Paenibacillus massiliensis]|uniref:DUF2262 domain-containing protein n=1 Tax=Paenibacillus massiliensis TaxID=225917 RepID=UPI000471D79B|nr:DUF2262 domain-containing protein [Paenibacillus massiliensis]